MSGLSFGVEPLAKLLADPALREMIEDYYEELSPLKHILPLDLDWAGMIEEEAGGTFFVWAARVDRSLAGFISFRLVYHPHHRRVLFAIDAGHFLAPAFRGKGRVGYRMWRTAEPEARRRGAKLIWGHDSATHSLMPFYLALSYEPVGTVFWKVL